LVKIENISSFMRFKQMTSKFPMNLSPGSNLELLEITRDTENREIFRGKFQLFVDYKWQQMKIRVYIHSSFYCIFAVLVGTNEFLMDES
jgi:hypothetical protein